MPDIPEPKVISGHPQTVNSAGSLIYLCANCERMRTVLFLSKDRWLCTACRNEGTAQPTYVPIGRAHD